MLTGVSAPGDNGTIDDTADIDGLLAEIRERLTDTVTTPASMQSLLEAVLVVGSGLELDSMLQRIVSAAVALLGARYGALGVRAPDGGLSEFVYVGIDPAERSRMGHLPEGRGPARPAHQRPAGGANRGPVGASRLDRLPTRATLQ